MGGRTPSLRWQPEKGSLQRRDVLVIILARVARGLAGKRMNAVGVIMAYHQPSVTSDSYLGACLDGILAVNKARHQKTILFTEDSWSDTLSQLPAYVDGAL